MDIEKSRLSSCLPGYDYSDRFEHEFSDPEEKIDLLRIAETFVRPEPGWLKGLLVLRDKIVGLWGLKTSDSIEITAPCDDEWKAGSRVGLFHIFAIETDEMVLGVDDKHLDTRILLQLDRREGHKRVYVTTLVKRHNLLGRCYFFFIKPFHKVIVPHFLKYNFRKLESGPHV